MKSTFRGVSTDQVGVLEHCDPRCAHFVGSVQEAPPVVVQEITSGVNSTLSPHSYWNGPYTDAFVNPEGRLSTTQDRTLYSRRPLINNSASSQKLYRPVPVPLSNSIQTSTVTFDPGVHGDRGVPVSSARNMELILKSPALQFQLQSGQAAADTKYDSDEASTMARIRQIITIRRGVVNRLPRLLSIFIMPALYLPVSMFGFQKLSSSPTTKKPS